MFMKRKYSFILIALLFLLTVGCGDYNRNDVDTAPEKTGGLGSALSVEKKLIGTWVAVQYKGTDGKTQDLDYNDSAQKITYTFDESTVTVVWGNQTTQKGTYEWYVKTADVKNITVHFSAVQNGDYQADAADVHFNLTFSEDTDKPTLTIQIQETGEVFVLRKNP